MSFQSETAYKKLRDAILSAALLPGEHLGEIEWAERAGVGRFAIREGLKRLHGEGLVTRTRGKYRVFVPDAEAIHEITHLRAVLEIGAIRFLHRKLKPKELAPIRKAAKEYAALVKKGYLAGAREADLQFHSAIVAAAGNPRLLRIYESSNLPLLHVTVSRKPEPLDDFDLAAAEHTSIVAALEQGDFGLAAERLEAHLRRGERAVIEEGL